MGLIPGKRKKGMDKISFVIPCFNNEENIDDLFKALLENEKQFSDGAFQYIMIDDASQDKTIVVLSKWQHLLPQKIKLVKLQKNIGSHKAVFKGLNSVTGDCIIVMAADLQDPPELCKSLLEEWKKENKLVLAVKENSLSFSSKVFHFIMRLLFVRNAPAGAFDYALFDKSLLTDLLKHSKRNCNFFYRLVEIQSQFSTISYIKQPRQKGKSGWTFSKKMFFFLENIIMYSFSKLGIVN